VFKKVDQGFWCNLAGSFQFKISQKTATKILTKASDIGGFSPSWWGRCGIAEQLIL
jgi:hypothetical protein